MTLLSSAATSRNAALARAGNCQPARRAVVARVTAAAPPSPSPSPTNSKKPISHATICALEADLAQGEGVKAIRRFNAALRSSLPADAALLRPALDPLFNEMCFNLESFNAAFTACILQVQRAIAVPEYYERRDVAIKNVIQPLAGEYGVSPGRPLLKTHRELFADFYQSLAGRPLSDLLRESPRPTHAPRFYRSMMRDILSAGAAAERGGDANHDSDALLLRGAAYALGYNLAVEYLGDVETTTMLATFEHLFDAEQGGALARAGLKPQDMDWVWLRVHAAIEADHAAIGHRAVLEMASEADVGVLRRAMADHDRDFAEYYNALAEAVLERRWSAVGAEGLD